MPHALHTSPGLQALILCGPGSSFPTFTANPDENPKALLPIANRPMVWYPIDFCYRTGITDITLVCPPSAAEAISSALNTNPFLTSLPHPRPDLLAPEDLDWQAGTAEILRLPEVQNLIKSDFVVLPCDLLCELGGEKLLQAWMVRAASQPMPANDDHTQATPLSGGLGVYYETKTATTIKGEETDFIATVPLHTPTAPWPKDSLLKNLSKLVTSMPTDSLNDLTEDKGGFPLRHGLLRRHPRVRMLTSHRDAHIYIFPKWIVDFVTTNKELDSIGEDVVGWWAKSTWQSGLPEKLGMHQIRDREAPRRETATAAADSNESSPEREDGAGSKAGRGSKSGDAAQSFEMPPMLAYVHPSDPDAPMIRRVDTAQLLLAVSLQLAKLPSVEEVGAGAASVFAHTKKVAYPEGVKPRTTITKQDSLVGENVTVEEKSSIKECVVGAGCQIMEGAKLSQCVLMDGVVVGKGSRLTRCILGRRSQIGEGCDLTNCEVQENLAVDADTVDKDNKLMSSEGYEATEEELKEAAENDEMDDLGESDDITV